MERTTVHDYKSLNSIKNPDHGSRDCILKNVQYLGVNDDNFPWLLSEVEGLPYRRLFRTVCPISCFLFQYYQNLCEGKTTVLHSLNANNQCSSG